MPALFARLLSLALLFACGSVMAQSPEAAPKPRKPKSDKPATPALALDQMVLDEIKTRTEIMANLGYLSDAIGPRLTGSKGLETANNWTAEKFRSYGLTNVHLEPWDIPVGWSRGKAVAAMVSPTPGRPLMIASRGWSPGTGGPKTGPVMLVDIRTKDDLVKYKGKLKNAYILRGKPSEVAPISDLSYGPGGVGPLKKETAKKEAPPKAKKQAAPKVKKESDLDESKKAPTMAEREKMFSEMRAFRTEVDNFLKTEGVAATLSDAGKPHGLLVTTGGWREGDRGTPQQPIPALYMAHEHYSTLYRIATTKGAKPPVITVEVENTFVPGPVTVFNTVAEVKGASKPDEFVVVGAHLDSWDLATGTTDNGTGSSIVLEAARVVAKLAREGKPPARTIRFVLFAGEEQGLYGSKRYCEKHADELSKTSAALVHDTGTGQVLGFGLQGREDVMKVLEPELETLDQVEGWDGLDLGRMGGTDHLSFESKGVPGFACRQDMKEYRLTHHTQSDTFDKAIEANLVQGAQVMTLTALRVANLPELLPRTKPEAKSGRRKGE